MIRSVRKQIRFTPEEEAEIEAKRREAGISSFSEYVRRRALGQQIAHNGGHRKPKLPLGGPWG